jgi:hypothetical protein
MFPHLSDDDKLMLIGLVLALLFGLFWWWNRAAKKWLEENGREEQWPSALEWLKGNVQQKPATPLKYSEQEFQEMVAKALDEVPEEFDKEWENVAVTVSTDWPTDTDEKRMGVPQEHLVFGTYSGFSRTKGFAVEWFQACHRDLPACTGIVLRFRQRTIGARNPSSGAPRISTPSWDVTSKDERNWVVISQNIVSPQR